MADTTKRNQRYYTRMSGTPCSGPSTINSTLNSGMTLDELVTFIARKTPLTSRQIEETLLTSINDMLDFREQNA